jgi:hypothetical protein
VVERLARDGFDIAIVGAKDNHHCRIARKIAEEHQRRCYVIERVGDATAAPPAGYEAAPRVRVDGVVAPGLIDLHNHLAYNTLPLWVGRPEAYGTVAVFADLYGNLIDLIEPRTPDVSA